jgi:hypothetical protein
MITRRRPTKLARHRLEQYVLDLRDEGKTVDEVMEAVNVALDGDDTISKPTIERFLAARAGRATPALHDPAVANTMVERTVTFAEQFAHLNGTVSQWLAEVQEESREDTTGTGTPPNWAARIGVARELREQLKMLAAVLDRVYDAEQIKLFQETVLDVIAEASPDMATEIRDRLAARTRIPSRAVGVG